MSFIYPLAFLFALTLPVIVLLYLLRLRRQKMPISSILLWRRSVEDLQANAPFQKLRNNLLLWLQLLVAALTVLALARPLMQLASQRKSYIVLVDTSASMKTAETGGRRMDLSRKTLDETIDSMQSGKSLWNSLSAGGGGEEMMIIAFDREARVVQTYTDSKSQLKAASARLQARDSISHVYEAMILARSVSESQVQEEGQTRKNVEIVVIGDGAISDLARVPGGMPPIRYIPVGSSTDNVGIVGLELRESFGRDTETQLFATVQNFGTAAVSALLECHIGGQLLDAKELMLDKGASTALIFSKLPVTAQDVELRLNRKDALESDDVAYGRLAASAGRRILLVTSDNYFLERALSKIPRVKLFKTTPGQYTTSQGYDLTVFDNFAPASLEPGSFLVFNAVPPMEGLKAGEKALEAPSIIDWSRVHPITRRVNFESLTIDKAIDIVTPAWSQGLAEGEVSPLIYCVERDQRQVVGVAFDIFDSDWAFRVSFPIFLANSVEYLTRASAMGHAFSYAAGQAIPFAPRAGEKEVVVTAPSGEERRMDVASGAVQYFSSTDENGFYRVETKGDGAESEDRSFAVNLLSADESNIAPRPKLALLDRDVAGVASASKSNREIWSWFAIGALGILVLEWIVYCRRTWL